MALLLPGTAFAQEEDTTPKGVFSFTGENDSLSTGADRNYTSGIKLSYVRPTGDLPGWLEPFGRALTAMTGARPEFWGAGIGQSLFTPEDIQANPAPPDQHPYAGWLYAQALLATFENRGHGAFPRYGDLYELEIGIVGPSALGEQSQKGIHQLMNAPIPNGWDSQLHDEVAFAVSYERRWSTLRLSADVGPDVLELALSPNVGATLGTLRTEARAGVAVQIGRDIINDYEIGPPRVRPSLSGAGYFEHKGFSWSLFAGVQGRAVARDLFLDGNTFEDSARVDKKPFVLDGQLGFTVQVGDARMAYTYVLRTDEFDTQGEIQDFGTVALQVRF
ncbi:MAG: lipid A deacylase LpxR family protein [Hyphomonadaceae bacterium]|nr:lipid A deacylase LpxR family protein [Hyphomonadaceae bacterium]